MGFQVFIAANVHNMFGRVVEGEVCFNKYISLICIVNAEAVDSTVSLILRNHTALHHKKILSSFQLFTFGLNKKRISHRSNKIKMKRYF